jgi:hypothetical protein
MDTRAPSTAVMPRHPLIAMLEATLASHRIPTAELSERLGAYVAAAAPNSLLALRCDFALIAASQTARWKAPLSLSPGDLYWLVDEQVAAGKAKS